MEVVGYSTTERTSDTPEIQKSIYGVATTPLTKLVRLRIFIEGETRLHEKNQTALRPRGVVGRVVDANNGGVVGKVVDLETVISALRTVGITVVND